MPQRSSLSLNRCGFPHLKHNHRAEEGEPLPADVVVIALGEVPIIDDLPENMRRVKGHAKISAVRPSSMRCKSIAHSSGAERRSCLICPRRFLLCSRLSLEAADG